MKFDVIDILGLSKKKGYINQKYSSIQINIKFCNLRIFHDISDITNLSLNYSQRIEKIYMYVCIYK